VNKGSLPKSQIIMAIMLSHSDISSYLSDEELFKFTGAGLDKELADQHRSRMKEMYEMTGPAAADNPWKGMNFNSILQPAPERFFQILGALHVEGIARGDGDAAAGAVLEMEKDRRRAGVVG
jgi:hypothetical protein